MVLAAISMQKAQHITDSGTRISRKAGVDLSGLMDHSTMAPTKMVNVMDKVHFNGRMGVIILASGVTIKCTALVNFDGRMVEYTLAIMRMTKSTDKAFILGPMVGATKASSMKDGNMVKVYIGRQMVKKFMGCGTWVKKFAYSTMSKTS